MSEPLLNRMRTVARGQTARGALGTLVVQGLSVLLRLAVGVVLARALGAQKYGIYAEVVALVTVLHAPAALGLPQLLIREVAVLLDRKEGAQLRGLLSASNLVVATSASAVAFLVVLVSYRSGGKWQSLDSSTLWVGMLLLPLWSLCAIRQGALQGLGRILPSQVHLFVVQPFLLLLGTGVYWAVSGGDLHPTVVVATHVASLSVGLAVGTGLLHKYTPDIARGPAQYRMKAWAHSALPFLVLAGMTELSGRVDVVMMGWFRAPDEVGIYRAAVTAGTFVMFGLQALNTTTSPQLARLYSSNQLRRLERLAARSAWASTVFAIPFFAVFALFGERILGLVFGAEFARGGLALLIIGAGHVVNAATGPVGMILNMTGHQRLTMWGLTVSSALNLSLNLWLIPLHGMEGAAIASTISLASWNLILLVFVRRAVGVDPSLAGTFRPQRCG